MTLNSWLKVVGPAVLCLGLLSTGFNYWNAAIAPSHALTVRIDGQPIDVETKAATVGEVLKELSISTNKGDLVTPSQGKQIADGMDIDIRISKRICLDIDGVKKTITTTGKDLDDALANAGIICGQDDLVDPKAGAKIRNNMRVIVRKATYSEVTERVSLANKEIRNDDPNLPRGTTQVVKPGSKGELVKVYRVCYREGRELYREQISETTERAPVDRILAVGTKTVTLASRHQDPAPEAPSAPVEERGVLANSQEGIASYYTLNGKGIGMTAAHKTLPFGTVVKVTNITNGKTVTVTINDRGPYVKGRVIDLATDAFRVIAPTSQGVCQVRLEW